MPPDPPSSLPRVQFDDFEGPLDLLLDEVRRQNVEIEKVAMAPIVSRFLDYVATASKRNLNLDIDWLHMAAILIHWKSQSLLPRAPGLPSEPDRLRETLVQQLLVHRRQAAEELDHRRSVAAQRFSRTESVEDDPVYLEEPSSVSVWDLVQQARELARWAEARREERRRWQEVDVQPDDVTVSEMIEFLRTQVPAAGDGKVDGARLMRAQPTASRRACLFLGMLEMARNRELHLVQDQGFGPIWIAAGSPV